MPKRPMGIIRKRVSKLKPGLDRGKALNQALRKTPGDFRGFTYDTKTGRAVLI